MNNTVEKFRGVCAQGFMLLALAPALHAAPPSGQLLASQCAQCHGTNGNGPGFEALAGKTGLYQELLEMKYKSQIETIMDRQARGYTDEQLGLIADYFASLPCSSDCD